MIALRPTEEVLGVLQLHIGRAAVVAYFVVVPRVSHPGNDHRSLVAPQFLENAVVVDPLDLADVVLVLALAVVVRTHPVHILGNIVLGKGAAAVVKKDDGLPSWKRVADGIGHGVGRTRSFVTADDLVAQKEAQDLLVGQQLCHFGHGVVPPGLVVRVEMAVAFVWAKEFRHVVEKSQTGTAVLVDVAVRNVVPRDTGPRVDGRVAAPHAEPERFARHVGYIGRVGSWRWSRWRRSWGRSRWRWRAFGVGSPPHGVVSVVEDEVAVSLHHQASTFVGVCRPKDFRPVVEDKIAVALQDQVRPGSTGRVGRPQHFVVGLVHDHVAIALHLEVCGLVRCEQLVFRIQGSPTRNRVASFRNGHATRLQYQLVEQRGEFGDIRDAAAEGGHSHGRAKEQSE